MIRCDGPTIILSGTCPVEEAEALVGAVLGGGTGLDLGGCTTMHAAVFQTVLAARLPILVAPADPFLAALLPPATVGCDEPQSVCPPVT